MPQGVTGAYPAAPVRLFRVLPKPCCQNWVNDCVLIKTIVSLDPSETQEMKALLEGKSVTCNYMKDQFNGDWINSLLLGIETCDGELRDILADLLLFA